MVIIINLCYTNSNSNTILYEEAVKQLGLDGDIV